MIKTCLMAPSPFPPGGGTDIVTRTLTQKLGETLGVQGFPNMMKAEKYVVDNHIADGDTFDPSAARSLTSDSFDVPSSSQRIAATTINGVADFPFGGYWDYGGG